MAIAAVDGWAAPTRADRNAFLVFVVLVWFGIVPGFGSDSFDHVSRFGLDYPIIVHVHAAIFSIWLILFTVQVALIRSRRADLHQKLGVAGAVLAAVMVVLGPVTALVVATNDFARPLPLSSHPTSES